MIKFDLDFTYEGQKEKALNDVEGTIAKGQCIVLCGHSGCGKSTIGRSINKLIPEFYEGELNGYCNILGKDLQHISIGEVGEMVSSVFQDPRIALH